MRKISAAINCRNILIQFQIFHKQDSLNDLELLLSFVGPKKYQKIARMYDRTGLSTKCTLIKTGFKDLRTGTEAKIRPFVDALLKIF